MSYFLYVSVQDRPSSTIESRLLSSALTRQDPNLCQGEVLLFKKKLSSIIDGLSGPDSLRLLSDYFDLEIGLLCYDKDFHFSMF